MATSVSPPTRRSHSSRSPRARSELRSSSKKRRPLHQRSDSETNVASNSPRLSKEYDDGENYSFDPFPKLPSQILKPRQRPFVYEDETATPLAPYSPSIPTLAAPPAVIRARSHSPTAGRNKRGRSPPKALNLLASTPVLQPSISVSSSYSALRPQAPSVRRLKQQYEQLGTSIPDPRSLYTPAVQEMRITKHGVEPTSPTGNTGDQSNPQTRDFYFRPDRWSESQGSEATIPASLVKPEEELPTLEGSKLDILDLSTIREQSSLSSEPNVSTPQTGADDPQTPVEYDEKHEQQQVEREEDTFDETLTPAPLHPLTSAQEDGTSNTELPYQTEVSRVLVQSPRSPVATPKRVLEIRRRDLRRSPSLDSLATPRRGQPGVASPDSPMERPRSASVSATDELIRALIESGANVQYPQLRQPSGTSFRTDASSIRRAYPAPLQLRRKRAISDMSWKAPSEAASVEETQSTNNPSQDGSDDRGLFERPSLASLSSQRSANSSLPPRPMYFYPRNSNIPENWTEELGDTVSELAPPALKRQRSGFYPASLSLSLDSRPTSRSSLRSSRSTLRVPFYNFLNDSHTAWARFYYQGDGRLRQITPPRVTQLESPVMLMRSQSDVSNTLSGRSNSPASAGFPETLYVPRLRPLHADQPEMSEVGSEDVESRTSRDEPAQRLEPCNATPDVPHLRRSSDFNGWTAPSLDESYGGCSFVNGQVFLFCIGFLLPFAWMIAACLPLPKRPDWQTNDLETEPAQDQALDLFESADVRRWKKAHWWRRLNRYMSLVGVYIFIIVIIAVSVTATK